MRFTLCLAAALTASFAARAEVLSLRCTITREGQTPYAGYVWIDMPTRRALEQWFPGGQRGPIVGPFHVDVLPNTVAISDPTSTHIDRAGGTGTIAGAKIFCDPSDVKPPPFPAVPKPVPPRASMPTAPTQKH
jgi:hypothetical protein